MNMRLDKFLCECTGETRTRIKKQIRKGDAEVNGEICTQPERKIIPETDRVVFCKKELMYQKYEYYMLYKPAGCVCAAADHLHDTIFKYLPMNAKGDLFSVGRLDLDTEGLLLVTNDGDLAHRLLSPRRHVDKVYEARVRGRLTKEDTAAFARGIDIGEKKLTGSASLTILSSGEMSECRVVISEGKFHQIKRMFLALGKEVLFLKRTAMGGGALDPGLSKGEYRTLTKEEMAYVEQYKSGHL